MKGKVVATEMRVLFVTSDVAGKMAPFNRQQADELKKAGVMVSHFQIMERGLGYLRAVKRLRIYLKENPVTLIHAHYSYCGWVADLARRKEKLIVSFVGSDIYGYPDANRFRRILWIVIQKITCWHARIRMELTIVMSTRMRKLCKSVKRCIVFPHGVDFEQYFPVDRDQARKAIGWPLDKKIILFPANPARDVKNFPLAEKTVTLLHDDQVILESFVNVPDDWMNFYYNAADVLLMTSKHEGSPCVVKEAMACNLPIVSTDVGDVFETTRGTDGCSVCSSDPVSLAAAVASVLKEGHRTKGREKIDYLDLDSVIKKQIGFYEKVLNDEDVSFNI